MWLLLLLLLLLLSLLRKTIEENHKEKFKSAQIAASIRFFFAGGLFYLLQYRSNSFLALKEASFEAF